jgi:hypothetical protein
MRFRATMVRLCIAALAVVAWMFVPSFLRTEESAKAVAWQMLREEFARVGVREDGFAFVDAKKSGFDWIVTWHSTSTPSAQIGVTITPFEADVWGRPTVPSCKDDRQRTIASFGEIC